MGMSLVLQIFLVIGNLFWTCVLTYVLSDRISKWTALSTGVTSSLTRQSLLGAIEIGSFRPHSWGRSGKPHNEHILFSHVGCRAWWCVLGPQGKQTVLTLKLMCQPFESKMDLSPSGLNETGLGRHVLGACAGLMVGGLCALLYQE